MDARNEEPVCLHVPESLLPGVVVREYLRVRKKSQIGIVLLFGKSGCIVWVKIVFLFVWMQPTPNLGGDEITVV
jgi:hypothetical protein